jgi:hypothetical protein
MQRKVLLEYPNGLGGKRWCVAELVSFCTSFSFSCDSKKNLFFILSGSYDYRKFFFSFLFIAYLVFTDLVFIVEANDEIVW